MSKVLKFLKGVKNEINVRRNGLHKLPFLIFGITQLNLFGLKHEKWSGGDGSLKRKILNIFDKLERDW